jgi:metal-responsive CopG/Arc/MetJ family transcriptional regulator
MTKKVITIRINEGLKKEMDKLMNLTASRSRSEFLLNAVDFFSKKKVKESFNNR